MMVAGQLSPHVIIEAGEGEPSIRRNGGAPKVASAEDKFNFSGIHFRTCP